MTKHEDYEDQEPKEDELWIVLHEGESDTRFGIARIDAELIDGTYRITLLYDSIDVVQTPTQMEGQKRSVFYAPLPEHDEWDERFEDLLDYALGLISRKEVAQALTGEPAYATAGREGKEALHIFAVDGIRESITEWSVHQGHGPSRYGDAVRQRVEDLPDWLCKDVLESELERWTGGFSHMENAGYIVEIRILQQQLLGEDHTDEIRDYVEEAALEYDQYREEEC